MSWSSFYSTADNLRRKEENLFENKDDDYLIYLNINQAKADMLLDLTTLLNCSETNLDSILTTHSTLLQEALSCKQLQWYFMNNDMGENSMNRFKLENYKKMYNDLKARFSSLNETISYTVIKDFVR